MAEKSACSRTARELRTASDHDRSMRYSPGRLWRLGDRRFLRGVGRRPEGSLDIGRGRQAGETPCAAGLIVSTSFGAAASSVQASSDGVVARWKRTLEGQRSTLSRLCLPTIRFLLQALTLPASAD